jgi:hypothetical protein
VTAKTTARAALRAGLIGSAASSLLVARAGNSPSAEETSVVVRRKRRANGLRLYHQVWNAANDLFFDPSRLEDWAQWEHRYDGRIRSVEGAVQLANEMLATLKDTYTGLSKEDNSTTKRESVVSTKILPKNIGYLRLVDFHQSNTADQMRRGLLQLRLCASIILDLRGNGGGYIEQALDCASLFLSRGTVVTYEQRIFRSNGVRIVEYSLRPCGFVKQVISGETHQVIGRRRRHKCAVKARTPIVVLVDGGTASSAEILSAALRDNNRAILIGEPTFGKGIGQSFRKMPNDYELAVTTFCVITPGGRWRGDGHLHKRPLRPDVLVKGRGRIHRSSLVRDAQLYAAFTRLGGSLD